MNADTRYGGTAPRHPVEHELAAPGGLAVMLVRAMTGRMNGPSTSTSESIVEVVR